ncbi:response regulator [Thiomicrorhabdus aquaedulcis]|uniref:response regulator n=1 Tax=Thiomicrorhabdus aquaedulcis TaxID=2211106 RepID=UPI000FDB8375|nr:response regulator [Thiomicrorhabdus aquaedulcis]
MRILVVDDQPMIRKLVTMTLNTKGYAFEEVDNTDDVLPKIESFKPNLIILDIMLPGVLDGFELCEKIKNNPKTQDIKVILLTATSCLEGPVKADYVGAELYLRKPFSPLALLNAVDTLMKS